MTLPRLWAFLAVALPTLAALIASLSSVDLAYHLRAGAEILDSGVLPARDTWTFTAAGIPWSDQQWGAQVTLATVHRLGGWAALHLFRAILVAVVFGCLFEIGRRRGLGMHRSAWLALAAFLVSAAALALRPQLMAMALFALVLLFVTDRREHPGRLWAVPLIVIAWANVHGSFFLGPLVLGLAWLEDLHDRQHRPHRTLVVAVVSMVAAFLTPLGPAVWGYAVGLTMNPEVTRRITEWQPTSVRDVAGLLFFGSVLAVVVLIARREKSTPWPTLLWLGAFFFIGVYAARGIAWWPLGAVAGIAGVLIVGPTGAAERREPTGTPILRRLNAVIAVTISVAGLALLPLWRPIDSRLNTPPALVDHAPPGITAELRTITRPGDHLFNPQPWGSWFEFALPEVRVAIDSRIELFPVDVWNAYDQVAAGADGWAERLEAWGVTIFVVSAGNEALTNRLAKAGWHQEYSDEDGVILLAPGRL